MDVSFKKHLVTRLTDLTKFVVAAVLMGFLIWKLPNQSEQLMSLAGAFVGLMGGAKLREKFNF